MKNLVNKQTIRLQIESETDAEIAFGISLEQAGVECDAFMDQWSINHHQFNQLSHYLYGLSNDVSMLPLALQVLVSVTRNQPLQTVQVGLENAA